MVLTLNGLRVKSRLDKLNTGFGYFMRFKPLDEQELTQIQQDWLALSRKIGPGPMTKSEREALEKLYKKMLPREQQELFEYIREHFGEKQSEPAETEDVISVMQRKMWTPPSSALRAALSRTGASRPRPDKDRP